MYPLITLRGEVYAKSLGNIANRFRNRPKPSVSGKFLQVGIQPALEEGQGFVPRDWIVETVAD